MFYIPNGGSTSGDAPFLVMSCVLATTGKLQPQTCTTVTFQYSICAHRTCIARYISGEINLADWRFWKQTAKLKSANINCRPKCGYIIPFTGSVK